MIYEDAIKLQKVLIDRVKELGPLEERPTKKATPRTWVLILNYFALLGICISENCSFFFFLIGNIIYNNKLVFHINRSIYIKFLHKKSVIYFLYFNVK